MEKYKVTEAFELGGVMQEVGAELELTAEQATELAGKVEKVVAAEPAADTPVDPAA